MKKGLFTLILLTFVPMLQAAILDQSQELHDGSAFVICDEWYIAQTFTAGLSGQLESIDLSLENYFPPHDPSPLFPTTVSIVDTIGGVPSGSVLGTVYAQDLIEGFNSIDFLDESVLLAADSQYGIVLFNEDTERYSGSSTQWRATGDVYPGGEMWSYTGGQWLQTVTPPGGLPDETFYDKDAAFRTYIVPEPATIMLIALGAYIFKNKR
ncbi:MAG: hypothetical protein ACYSWP_11765 [Planctomycetota bacterium]|jgi:hypothetical protein